MKPYRDLDRDSAVIAYEDGPGFIIVMFKGSSLKYGYNDLVTGAGHVAEMRRLAALGDGLNRYINLHVRKRYARKYR